MFFVAPLGCGCAVASAITGHENHSILNSFWLILILSNTRQTLSLHQRAEFFLQMNFPPSALPRPGMFRFGVYIVLRYAPADLFNGMEAFSTH